MSAGIGLTKSEIAAAFNTQAPHQQYGPCLNIEDVAAMLRLSKKTIYEWIAKGYLDGTYCKRGKRILFWRNRLIDKLFNTAQWKSSSDPSDN